MTYTVLWHVEKIEKLNLPFKNLDSVSLDRIRADNLIYFKYLNYIIFLQSTLLPNIHKPYYIILKEITCYLFMWLYIQMIFFSFLICFLFNIIYIKWLAGYKRVAWPPASDERIVREFTPQPQAQYQPEPSYNHQQQPYQQSAVPSPQVRLVNLEY